MKVAHLVSSFADPASDGPGDELVDLAAEHEGFSLHQLHTDTDGILDLADLDAVCADWRERET